MNQEDWQFPGNLQPDPASTDFKLDVCLNSVVSLRAEIPEDGFTADTLGTSRQGNGVLINSTGLILTIGYLITEAETIWLSTNQGESVPGTVIAYDQVTGFGFVQALGTLRNIEPIPVGSAKNLFNWRRSTSCRSWRQKTYSTGQYSFKTLLCRILGIFLGGSYFLHRPCIRNGVVLALLTVAES